MKNKKIILQVLMFSSPLLVLWLVLEYHAWKQQNSYTLRLSEYLESRDRAEVLVLGSSHALGVNATLMGVSALNLANVSQSLGVDRALFLKLSPSLPKLKLVILPISYFSLRYRLKDSPEYWREYFNWHYFGVFGDSKWTSKWDARSLSLALTFRAAEPSYLLKETNWGRKVASWISPPKAQSAAIVDNAVSTSDGRMGAQKPWGQAGSSEDRLRTVHSSMSAANIDYNLNACRDIMSVAKARGVKVVLLTLPVSEEFLIMSQPGIWRERDRAIDLLKKEFPDTVHFEDLKQDIRLTDKDFTNADHLSLDAFNQLSGWLGNEVVKPRLVPK